MIKKVPDGAGCVMLDAGDDAHENYKMIRSTGRRPVICTCKNHVVKGCGPMAEILRWQEKNPEEFEKYKDFLTSLYIRCVLLSTCLRPR